MKKISIIMPVYNVQDYLRRAVDSVLTQTYTNFELILINDGSTDESGKICDEYLKDERVKVYHKQNSGVSSTRNFGLDVATGDYIAFIDSDDYVDIHMYQKLVEALETNDSDVAMCGFEMVYEDGTNKPVIEKNLSILNSGNIHKYFLETGSTVTANEKYTDNIMGCIWRTLYKKDVLKDIKFRGIAIAEDLVFNIEVFKQNLKIAVVDECLYKYFQRNTSVMNSYNQARIEKHIKGFKEIMNQIDGLVPKDDLDAYKFNFYAQCANMIIKYKIPNIMKELSSEFFVSLNTKENYLAKKKKTKGIKRKIAYFFIHKRMFKLYSFLIKFV